MRPFNVKLICFIGLLVGFFVIIGCGTQDILDENGQRYRASFSLSDAGDDGVLTIDVTRDLDCDDDGNNTDPEPFTDVFADISVTVSADAPGISLDGYTIEFIPERTNDTAGVSQLPPELPDITDQGSFTIEIPSGSTSTFTTTCMPLDQKADYVNKLFSDPALVNLNFSRYTIRITMFFVDEFLVERTITESRTVEFGFYDNC